MKNHILTDYLTAQAQMYLSPICKEQISIRLTEHQASEIKKLQTEYNVTRTQIIKTFIQIGLNQINHYKNSTNDI